MKHLLFIFLSFCTSSLLYAQQALNLDSCRALAIKNNKALQISQQQIRKAYYERKAAFTKYLPDFSATGTYMHFSDEISLLSDSQKNRLNHLGSGVQQQLNHHLPDFIQHLTQVNPELGQMVLQFAQSGKLENVAAALDKIGQDITDAFRTDTRNMWAGAVTMTQPLYMGGKIRAYNRIMEYSEDLAHTQHQTQIQEIIYNTDQAYWTVVSLTHKKHLAESYLELVRQLNSDVQKMIQEGVATQADGLTVKVKVNEAEMTQTKVENGLSLAKMVLCQLCGLDLTNPPVLADESTNDLPILFQSINSSVDNALIQRPELKGLQLAGEIYDNKIRLQRAEMLPSLALTGGYLISNPSVLNGFEKKFKGMWNIGVVLQIPLYHWNERIYKVKAARAEANIAKLQLHETQEKIELQVNQSTFKVEEAQKRLTMSLKNLEKAHENLNYANKGFREGVMPVSHVMEAQTAWLSAQSDKIDAQIDVRLADTYLQKAMGILTVSQ